MNERVRSGEGGPNAELIALLRADFTPPEIAEFRRRGQETGSALSDFLSHARSTGDIEARFASAENHQLADRTMALLEGAATTQSFRMYVARAVSEAHGYGKPVDKAVSPEALGLMDGSGVFSPEHAQAIEAKALGRFVNYVAAGSSLTDTAFLGAWVAEFSRLYGDTAVVFAERTAPPGHRTE